MPTRSHRPSEFFLPDSGAETLIEHAHNIATQQLIPRLAEKNKVVSTVVPTLFHFFQAIRAGRQCSCFNTEVSATEGCPACFGTGYVGGYNKFGTAFIALDVTYPNLKTTNITVDHTQRTTPLRFKLIDDTIHGSLETRIEIKTNTGELDRATEVSTVPEGTTLTGFIKSPTDTNWVDFTYANLQQRLINPWLDLKVDFDRTSPNTTTPYLDLIYIRYKNIVDNVVKVNIPRATKSIALQEWGVIDDYQTQNFWMDNTLKSVTTEDFFVSVSGNSKFKIISVKESAPYGKLVGWDVEVRLIQQGEKPYSKIPI